MPLTVNQLVAYNLARARRHKGWTQDETANRLTVATGKRWTSATLGAAERSWETGRTREFNANELLAFCVIFHQPLAYFFLPREECDGDEAYSLGTPGDGGADFVGALELAFTVLAAQPSTEFEGSVRAAVAKHGLTWLGGELARDDESSAVTELRRDLERRLRQFERDLQLDDASTPLPPKEGTEE